MSRFAIAYALTRSGSTLRPRTQNLLIGIGDTQNIVLRGRRVVACGLARKARVRFEGAIYHVYNRGIDRRELFWDTKDGEEFLDSLRVGVERFHARVYAYCLMPNHYHLLVETPLGNIDRFMQSVQTRYAGYFNLRQRRRLAEMT